MEEESNETDRKDQEPDGRGESDNDMDSPLQRSADYNHPKEKGASTSRSSSPLGMHAAIHHMSEAIRFFGIAALQGVTDAQIAEALRKCLPELKTEHVHHVIRAMFHDRDLGARCTGKKQQQMTAEIEQNDCRHKKKMQTTKQNSMAISTALASDVFSGALIRVPAEDWCRTWAADRTFMLRITSKTVKEAVDKLRPPAVVRLNRTFYNDASHGTATQRLHHVLVRLSRLPARCRIVSLNMNGCVIRGKDADRLTGVLEQCPALSQLCLLGNGIGAEGAGRLAGVLAHCRALSYLDLRDNDIGAEGAGRLAGVLGQCLSLAHLDLRSNHIGTEGAIKLAGVLRQCSSLSHLDLYGNHIGIEGAFRLAGVLGQCKALSHLDLSGNYIGAQGAERLVEGLAQCPEFSHLYLGYNCLGIEGAERLSGVLGHCLSLSHLDLSCNHIGDEGAERLAGVLMQCPALSHLNLRRNGIGTEGAGGLAGVLGHCPTLSHLILEGNAIGAEGAGLLRASWRGQTSGLVL